MKEQEIYNHQLAIRYFEGRITPSEEEILFRFVNDAPSNERMFRQWEEEWMLSYKLFRMNGNSCNAGCRCVNR
jgi:transmembrane sensor